MSRNALVQEWSKALRLLKNGARDEKDDTDSTIFDTLFQAAPVARRPAAAKPAPPAPRRLAPGLLGVTAMRFSMRTAQAAKYDLGCAAAFTALPTAAHFA